MSDNDDLDALLDEAMDIVDETERQHEVQVKEHEAKLDADIQKALDEQSGLGGDGPGGDMIKMFQSLLGAGGGPGDIGDDDSFETFKRDVAQLVSTLEGVDDLKDEDKANLDRVRQLMDVLDNDDEDKAKKLLNQMKNDPTSGMPSSDANPDDMEAAFKNVMDSMQKLAAAGPDGEATGETDPTTAAAAAAAAMGEDSEVVPDNVANLLMEAILDPQFVEPIRVMRDAYEPYFAANGATLSSSETERYQKQYAKTTEICAFLAVPLHKEDDVRVVRLLELMSEFSELGEPPKTLVDYAPEKTAQQTE